MAWAKSGGFGGAAILQLTTTRLVPSSRLIKTISIVTNLPIHGTMKIKRSRALKKIICNACRRGQAVRSAQPDGLNDLPWSSQKMYGGPSGVPERTVRCTRILLTGPSAEIRRTVRFTNCQPNSVSDGSAYSSLMAGGPSACHDRTVRATHLNCQTILSGSTDTFSQHIRAAPIKSYDPNVTYKGP